MASRSPSAVKAPTAAEFALAVSAWEGQSVEFKESVSDALAREFVAFANSGGGRIYLGVTDSRQIKGVKITNRLLSQVQDTARNCDPPVHVNLAPFKYDGSDLLMIEVLEGEQKPHGCSAGYFLRTGASSQKMNRDELIRFLRGAGTVRFDELPCDEFRYPSDFDRPAFRDFLDRAGITARNVRDEDLLVNLGLAQRHGKRLVLKNAGVLFFAKDPRRFHLHSRVTCLLFRGATKTQILDRKDFDGRLPENVEGAMTFLKRHVAVGYEITGLQRKELPAVPELAAREAVLNAVIHRDYFERGGVVMVELFQDRLQVTNPGGLVEGFRLEDLGRFSLPRNPLLADLFLRLGYVERAGSGIQRIREAVAAAGMPPPVFESSLFFLVGFSLPQKAGRETAARLGATTGTKSAPSQHQVELLALCQTPRTLVEMMAASNRADRTKFRKSVLAPLLHLGLLEATIPDKPRSRFQKYVTTTAGWTLLEEIKA